MSVMTGDRRYEEILAHPELTKGVSSMCNVAQILENKGIAKGRTEGQNEKGLTVYHNLRKRGFSKEDAIEIADISPDLVKDEE